MLYVAYGVLAKLRLIQYTVRKKKVTSGAQEKKKDSAVHYVAHLCQCCRAQKNKKQ